MARYLVGVFTVTAGLQEESLGSDEQEIVLFSWVVVDLTNTKVVVAQTDVVKPRGYDVNENSLSDVCRTELGLTEEQIKTGQPLEQVIEQLDQFVQTKLSPGNGGPPFYVLTDGQLHLRQVLHPEACHKNITLPNYYYSFFDIRKEFRKFYQSEEIHSIPEMLDYLAMESDGSADYSMQQVQNVAKIAIRLAQDGHTFEHPEIINKHLEPGICTKNELVDNNTVVRARGLPWQSSDQDIAKFFRGLNIVRGGVALCLSAQGRRNGEALVRFESQEHRDMALKRHKHHIGQRYIEVYRATGDDFVNVAGGNNNEAQAFLSRGGQVIVRMRGLPYDCTPKQVLTFFASGESPCQVMDGEDGVLFVKKADGRATGDAFVLFQSEDMASRALQKHREVIGSRYIELFRSTTAEVQQVLNRCMDPRTYEQQQPLLTNLPQVPLISPQLLPPGSRKDCIRLRGLPFEAQVEQILEFLGEHSKNIVYQGVHMVYNAQGQPSGEAFIQMDTEHSAFLASQQRHHRYMVFGKKQRYIEVFQCSVDDMTLVLNGGIPVQRSLMSAGLKVLSGQLDTRAEWLGHLSSGQQSLLSLGGSMLPPPYGVFPYVQSPQILPAVAPLTPRLPAAYYSPVFYWPYPSPPVSPTTYYPHSSTTVLTTDCIPVQRNGDVRPSSEAIVPFPAARIEAERALQEKNRQNLSNRNHIIELFMA